MVLILFVLIFVFVFFGGGFCNNVVIIVCGGVDLRVEDVLNFLVKLFMFVFFKGIGCG